MELCEIGNEQFRNLSEKFLEFLKAKAYKDSTLAGYRRTLARIDIYIRSQVKQALLPAR